MKLLLENWRQYLNESEKSSHYGDLYLFENDTASYERVISQIITYQSWEEVTEFLNQIVKPEYNSWKDKEEVEARFLTILQNNFTA